MSVLVEVRAMFQETHQLCPFSFHYTFSRRTWIISTSRNTVWKPTGPGRQRYHFRIGDSRRDKVNSYSVAERARVLESDRHSFKVK